MLNEQQRLELLISYLEGGNAAEFGRKTGIDPTHLSRIKSGQLRLITRTDKILRAYPQVNREWLETGDGFPGEISVSIVKEYYSKMVAEKDIVIRTLAREIEQQQEVIARLLGK